MPASSAPRTGLSADALKLFAIVAMTIDHIAWFLYPGYPTQALPLCMHLIGRLTCDGCLAVRKRKSRGLLAGLWELPNVEGTLEAVEVIAYAESAGCEPAELLKSVERVHVFTHITWHMRCYYIVCRRKSPEFVWADEARRSADVALPTAFRMFVNET